MLKLFSFFFIQADFYFKRKYEEEQKRLEMSLKIDFEKVKEEEIQRREQVSF